MRIAVAGFAHESNTFYSQPTRLGDFGVCEGEAILSHYANTFHAVSYTHLTLPTILRV